MTNEQKDSEITKLGIGLIINGDSVWLAPNVLYEVGKLEGRKIFLYMDNDGMINLSSGAKEDSGEILQYFS